MLQPFGETASGGRQSPTCLEGDLYERGELTGNHRFTTYQNSHFVFYCWCHIYIHAHSGQVEENIRSVQQHVSESQSKCPWINWLTNID
jgi:hypothetical protein